MSSVPPPTPSESDTSADPGWASGPVTRLGTPTPAGWPDPATTPTPQDPSRQQARRLWWFGGVAGAVLVTGLAVVLVLVLSGNPDPFRADPGMAPPDVRPPLARLCPAPTAPLAAPTPPAGPGPALTGPRTVDEEAGISYRAYGSPWQPWDRVWRAGTLRVPYRVGQHFITEPDYDGVGDYHASILSGAVPAADNDALILDIECVGRQVAADVRAEYYPQPNRMDPLRDERTTLGGRPAWISVFRLHFQQPGLTATDELAAVACIDVGRPTAAILYVSIPGTHRQLDWIVDDVLASVAVT